MESYDKLKLLGNGSFSQVFLARSHITRRLVAIKEVRLDQKSKYRTAETIKSEAKILSKMKHPHVVTFQDSFFGEGGQFLYIVQDYYEGGSLFDKVCEAKENETYFGESQIMKWFVQLLMAIQYLHTMKILHRDIKSPNVFLTKKQLVKLGDFGVSRIMDNTFDMAQSKVGTPCYLSPELCQDLPYSSKSDIWSMGCLLYELCALKPAFDATNLVTLFYKIVKTEYKPLPPQFSSDINELIRMALTKNADERPSAGALLSTVYVKDNLQLFISEQEAVANRADTRQENSSGGSIKMAKNSSLLSRSSNDELKDQSLKSENDYSDDFESSDSGDTHSCGKDFENRTAANDNSTHSSCGDYSDDFEDYESDDDQVILTSAKAAKNKDQIEDLVQDNEGSECKARITEHCINELGSDLYRRVLEECSKSSSDQNLNATFTVLADGNNQVRDTFYLVKELLIHDESKMSKSS
ncbi:Serine/threonine-protein kinase Nek1 [Trichoplax sp. H2]|uniref:non-specific serine/threonine protein kinase n=1 Tax=Trichoplax adhaerens TaxID=10228 RepID=B3RKK0_TRIAD|nr:hypothetical protein TRIADDRAFT_51708 [Trichoplax adhaerens]EDV29416.1 hypothetical protein TRIADDRAFT_51708 [Trichoplax adhaerens]RDD44659.1 Serine/threonine-protein kinase Nek1 [Trichoplax sp. H2]|eukprot:XP_002108618.1 hypothetical protein TRIADDRAFT_51708 [Trichoplax adhaerens]